MDIHPIRTESDYDTAVARIEALIDAENGTPEYEELDVLATLIDAYEKINCPIDPPTPIEAIKFRMEQGQIPRAVLAALLGGSAKTTEVLNGKRQLSKKMIARLHTFLGISLKSLMGDQLKTAILEKEKPSRTKANKRTPIRFVGA